MNQQMLEARRRLFYPFDLRTFSKDLSVVVSALPARAKSLGDAFEHNLSSVLHTVTLPFVMAYGSVSRRRFQALHAAEQIRARNHCDENGEVPQWAKEEATKTARQRMLEETASVEWGKYSADAVLQELGEHLNSDEFSGASNELLKQGVVLVWGALEVLIRDSYREIRGNDSPGPKAALKELFPAISDGRVSMQRWNVWTLFQRRHLIVHRRGIIDASYLQETGAVLPLGQELVILPSELEKDFEHVRDAGIELLGLIH